MQMLLFMTFFIEMNLNCSINVNRQNMCYIKALRTVLEKIWMNY